MDNRRMDVTSEGRTAFDLAFQLAFAGAPGGKARGWRDDPKLGLVFFWELKDGALPLPISLAWTEAADLAWTWVNGQQLGSEPDIDGSCGRGWRVYNEAWGHVGGSCYAFVAVQATWALYGK